MDNKRKDRNYTINLVKMLLMKNKKLRSNDMLLFMAYIKAEGGELSVATMTNPTEYGFATYETIARRRRKLQEQDRESGANRIQPEEKSREKRLEMQEEFRKEFGKGGRKC